ncbi:telomerase reverse transcriptase-like isoform X1 [Selaginella moellendorffii]|uniref:telomerase reverse transcriptase-like isoform X1 n=1 Tax=Selaginella moellendorffii TaxID=88036 RepID=UPI000D1CF631|nr:telomerase reverse transcriptase-like isoform X1 [Selaginella moellendorffii]XP_024531884.1 telomerase reverse transcriptase-like isoform X1 [Selaginella moellendorffii]|eukprot:XP_024531883.1 telomerase reverse transcriptase-like isoform X1 [Selaginella moellendorffii]
MLWVPAEFGVPISQHNCGCCNFHCVVCSSFPCDLLMLHLLSHAAVFASLPNCCYMQVSGTPITLLASASQRRISQEFLSFISSRSHEKSYTLEGVINENSPQSISQIEPQGAAFKKRRRPFSWQRRKKQKVIFVVLRFSDLFDNPQVVERLESVPAACHRQIDRAQMFYSTCFNRKGGLPKTHILFTSAASKDGGAAWLFESIFGSKTTEKSYPPSILRLLKRLICRAKKFQCGHLLKRHCPVPILPRKEIDGNLYFKDMFLNDGYVTQEESRGDSSCSCKSVPDPRKGSTKPKNERPLSELLAMTSTNHQVVAFLWAASRRLIPQEMLGSPKNWRALRKQYARFVGLRRYEAFSSVQLLQKLKVSDFTFLSKRDTIKELEGVGYFRSQMVEDWLYWIFTNVLVPLIRVHFYVTESENQRQNVVFYRKPIWSQIQSAAVRDLSKTVYKRVDADKALRNRALGFSKVRLLPKKTSVRPIANLGSASIYVVKRKDSTFPKSRKGKRVVHVSHRRRSSDLSSGSRGDGKIQTVYSFKSVNSALGDAHQCLKLEQESHQGDLGASVFGYNDIYLKLLPFIRRFRQREPTKIFLAVCDVANAFDTIDQERLYSIVDKFLHEEKYVVLRFTSVRSRLASVRVLHEKACATAGSDGRVYNFVRNLTTKRSETIFTDQAYHSNVSRVQLLRVLKEHIKSNILHLGHNFFQQFTGIPQGSVLSSFLCALYYGYLDLRHILPALQGKPQDGLVKEETTDEALLMRLVDDSLFISTSEAKATLFLNVMHRDLEQFGCCVNEDKTSTSFDTDISGKNVKSMYSTEDGACFMRWSGLLINCHTLEIQADYTRYCGEHIRSSLTVMRCHKQGLNLVVKMFHFMRPKCHPVFYDSEINSASTISLNAYQAFLLCAMKFHAYLKCLRPFNVNNPLFLFQAIRRTTRYTFRLIRQRMQAVGSGKVLSRAKEMEWLGWAAFHKVLSKKQSTHKRLLLLIQRELKLDKYKHYRSAPHMLSATDETRSSMFKTIRF